MALDTRDKRSSAVSLIGPWGRVWPNPDGSLANAPDRQHVAYVYRGITAEQPSAPSDVVTVVEVDGAAEGNVIDVDGDADIAIDLDADTGVAVDVESQPEVLIMGVNCGTKRPHAGQDLLIRVRVKQPDGDPQDLTGWTGKAQIGPEGGPAQWSGSFALGEGYVAADGVWEATCPYATNLAWGERTYYWEARATAPSKRVLAYGIFTFKRTVET